MEGLKAFPQKDEGEKGALDSNPRLSFIDNLRVFLIILVILVHLAITYGAPIGFWYYHEGQADKVQGTIYILFQSASQAFYMGLLFLVSGYFTPNSYQRKGPKQFLKDRLIKLGIPLLVFALLIEPLMEYFLAQVTWFHGSFTEFISIFISVQQGLPVGPLWFVEALLLFTFAYAAWKYFVKKPVKVHSFPSIRNVLTFGLMLGAVTFVVRLAFPIGSTFSLLGLQICFFPQYIALFIVGLAAFQGKWFLAVHKETGRFWGSVALALLLLLPLELLVGTTVSNDGISVFFGGLNWQSAVYAVWEQLFCVATVIGLSVWFRERLNISNRLTKALSESSYAAYFVQAPVLIFLALGLQGLEQPLLLKFLLISPVAVCLCFLVGFLVRKIPKIDKAL